MEIDARGAEDAQAPDITVMFRPYGEVRAQFSEREYKIVLARGSTLRDLCARLAEQINDTAPKTLWLHEEKRFAPGVLVTVNGKITNDLSLELGNLQSVHAYRLVIGG